ncbi:2-desacetyl-2-hydroxyethyl bacteriochlorophyllide A dehydrogenase [Singulisphaera sp. GP187]|uniref:zinc-binding dehydrogenase n=1 Tax=Singulisphaera sp. GP187 TaxID=1882752 RepID=UPI00092ACC90|nr:zinc-binding dehydrogenase [Singulisphaera sp. GP187]SIO61643.1 2-desacetyl-2-hydroxyethyl bacteriochlorophyllide A dehydrogenase [Singulisphaera sp. GP187]
MTHSCAAVFDGVPDRLELRRLAIPALQPSEILVQVLGCTLCGSDLHSVEGRRPVPVPTVLGHEIVGEIVEFAGDVPTCDLAGQELKVGDRVTWAIVANCGHCDFCNRGLPQKCLNAIKYGHEPFRPGRALLGGLAEHCLLVAGTGIVRLPDPLPIEVACPASCATATIAAALEAAGDLQGRHVCVFGAGMLGLTACAMARVQGAGEVVCIDPNDTRRERALSFGASRVAQPGDLATLAAEVTGPHGFDVVLELSGHPSAFETAWPHIRVGGTLVLVGSVFPAPPVSISLEQIVRRHLTIRGIHNYAPWHLLAAVDFLSAHHGQFPFAALVAHWLPLSSVAEAFTQGRDPRAIRVGVRPDRCDR